MRIALVGTCRGVTNAFIMHAQLATSSSITQADLDTWTAAFASAFKTRFQAVLPTDFTFSYAKSICYTPGGTELVSTNTPTAWSGTGAGASLSGSVCKVVSWTSSVYWRGGKPRTYLPGVSGDWPAGSELLSSGVRTALATAGTNFRADVNALTAGTITGTQFGFISFRSGNADRVPPVFFAISGCVVHPRLASQRRRLGKWQN